MPVIDNGNVIENEGHQTEGSRTRRYPHNGVPTAGTTYDGIIEIGQFVEDMLTGDLYEYTEPAGTPTFTRIDTV